MNKASSEPGINKSTSLKGLKFVSININGIRGKKLERLAFLEYHKPDIVAIQETKIDGSISTSELFSDSCSYNAYRKDRNLHRGGMMLLIHEEIPHMPLTELENDLESVLAKIIANKTSHYIASWYRELVARAKTFSSFEFSLSTLSQLQKLLLVHILCDFNFRYVVWPDRLTKIGPC